MKTVILILCLLSFNALPGKAQEVSFAFNSTDTGRNYVIAFTKHMDKSELGAGLRYNINMFAHPDDQMNIYHKRQYATKPLDHLGMQAYYHRFIWSYFFAFYDMQISHSQTFNRIYSPYTYDLTQGDPYLRENVLYKMYLENFGPFTWVEQYIGIGLKLKLTESILLSQKAGVGIDLIFGTDPKLPKTVLVPGPGWEFGFLLSIGVGFKF